MSQLTTPVQDGYAYGWNVVRTSRGTRLIHHGGAGTGGGMRATFRWFPDEDLFFAILSGAIDPSLNGDYVAKDVEGLLFGGSPMIPPAAADRLRGSPATDFAGTYRLDEGGEFRLIERPGNRLVLVSSDPKSIPLVHAPDIAGSDDIPQDRKILALATSLMAGDYAPLRPYLSSDNAAAYFKKHLDDLRKRAETLGKVRAIRVVRQRTFDFDGMNELQTLIGVRFDKADGFLRILQTPGSNPTINALDLSDHYVALLAPIGARRFASWDSTWGLATAFNFAEEGRVAIRGSYTGIEGRKVG
jgi:hypothetical protein